ncbi:phage baseplate protein [Raoultella ornithinolytica]|uniref:phage baseplate protein n=1 Tax=Raoultella ornithinolytica TaxID=54291 RepID=UPI001F2BBFA8|nr:hypothetical protein [Raoultella ornithinolytica]MCF6660259.1 hypothetical protein [Raoultella ornithinolytica]
MTTKSTVSNTSGSTSQEGNTVTYLFLASRLFSAKEGGNVKTDESGAKTQSDQQKIISLDVTTKFNTKWEGDLTKYPVSQGSDITDHITIRNNKFSLEGVISNTPFELHDGEYFSAYGTGTQRTKAAVNYLEEFFKNKTLFTLYSEFQKIDNCIITGIEFDQEAQEAINFKISIEQTRLAFAKQVTLNVSKSTKKSVASNTNSGGSAKSEASNSELSGYKNKKAASNKRLNGGGA